MRCASESGIGMSRQWRQNGRVITLRGVVVQHDEVARLFHLDCALLRCIDRSSGCVTPPNGNRCSSRVAADHHEMDAGGFQRLDEAAGQTHRDAVLVPDLPPAAGLELEHARLR